MTLDEAIEVLETEHDTAYPHGEPAFYQALTLGIEALRRIDFARRSRDVRIIDHLPGETED